MTTNQTLDSQVSQLMQKVEEQKQIVQETESQTKRGWATNCAYSLNGKTVNIQTSSIDICVKLVADIIVQSKAISEARGVLGLPYEPIKIDAFTPDEWIEDVKKRVAVIGIREKRERLTNLESRLADLLSVEQRRKMELDKILKDFDSL